jgi:hypothetical protein
MKTIIIAVFFILIGSEATGSDFWSNYIFKHYPASSVTQLRTYSCEDLNSLCNWVEFKDAVLDKNCEQIYSKDSSEHAACLKVIGREDIFFGKLKSCEKDSLNKNCLTDSRYKYSCDGNYSTKIERSVCKEIIIIFDYCESIVYSDYKKNFPACHMVIRDRKAFSKTGCKKHYGDSGPAIFYRCMKLFDNGRASGSRTKKGLNAAFKVYCKDITRRKEKEMEIYSKEFSCKMQTFWSNEESTLCEKKNENTCFSKAANVW